MLRPTIAEMQKRGLSLGAMAKELNKQKVATPRGGKWHTETVRQSTMRRQAVSTKARF